MRSISFLKAQPPPYPCATGDIKLNHLLRPHCKELASAKSLHTDKDVEYETNSLGLRMPELRSGAKKFLVLGDSYTEGFGLANQDTFPAQLERKLGPTWQVINGGILGFSTALYPLLYQEKLSSLKPSYVLLNLDFTDMNDDVYFLERAEFDADSNPIAFPTRDFLKPQLAGWVYQNKSAVVRFLHQEGNIWYQSKMAQQKEKYLKTIVERTPHLISQSWLDEDSQTKDCWKKYELTAKFVMALKEKVEKDGAHFAIHMYPPGYLIKKIREKPQNISFVGKWQSLQPKEFTYACSLTMPGVKVFQKMAEAQHIPFFNSVELIKNHPAKEKLYFDEDAHWNKEGVKVVTEFLAPKLEKDFLKLSAKQGKRLGQ